MLYIRIILNHIWQNMMGIVGILPPSHLKKALQKFHKEHPIFLSKLILCVRYHVLEMQFIVEMLIKTVQIKFRENKILYNTLKSSVSKQLHIKSNLLMFYQSSKESLFYNIPLSLR